MRKISVIMLLIVACACSDGHKKLSEEIEIIPVDVHETIRDASSFLEKIELVPLETNDSSLFYRTNKVIYVKKENLLSCILALV